MAECLRSDGHAQLCVCAVRQLEPAAEFRHVLSGDHAVRCLACVTAFGCTQSDVCGVTLGDAALVFAVPVCGYPTVLMLCGYAPLGADLQAVGATVHRGH